MGWRWGTPRKDMAPGEVLWDGDEVLPFPRVWTDRKYYLSEEGGRNWEQNNTSKNSARLTNIHWRILRTPFPLTKCFPFIFKQFLLTENVPLTRLSPS